MINHNSKNGVNDQRVISSWLITCLGEGWECRYLIRIGFRYALRWVGATPVRCWEDELRFGKVSVMLREGSWVVDLSWNALKLKNCISILNGETRVCRWFWLFKLSFLAEHLPLFIWKVMEWFGGRRKVGCSENTCGPKHARGWIIGDSNWHVLS